MFQNQLSSYRVTCHDVIAACVFQNQLSGYLLRKFKNSNGWQKLWVVFTNFCLFFYKTYQVSVTLRNHVRRRLATRVLTSRIC